VPLPIRIDTTTPSRTTERDGLAYDQISTVSSCDERNRRSGWERGQILSFDVHPAILVAWLDRYGLNTKALSIT
jgi:hypothetical protein